MREAAGVPFDPPAYHAAGATPGDCSGRVLSQTDGPASIVRNRRRSIFAADGQDHAIADHVADHFFGRQGEASLNQFWKSNAMTSSDIVINDHNAAPQAIRFTQSQV